MSFLVFIIKSYTKVGRKEFKMKLNEMRKTEVVRAMPYGKNEVVFEKIEYREDENKNVNGAWVHVKDFKPLFIPIFEENNYQLDLLTEQLGIDTYDDREINKAKGTVIIAHKYKRYNEALGQEFTNISFNPRYGEPEFSPEGDFVQLA